MNINDITFDKCIADQATMDTAFNTVYVTIKIAQKILTLTINKDRKLVCSYTRLVCYKIIGYKEIPVIYEH